MTRYPPVDSKWKAAHPEFHRRQTAPTYAPKTRRTLEARNEFHQGTAVFVRVDGIWTATALSPCLRFLAGLDPAGAKMELLRRGYDFSWSDANGESASARSPKPPAGAGGTPSNKLEDTNPRNGVTTAAGSPGPSDTGLTRGPTEGSVKRAAPTREGKPTGSMELVSRFSGTTVIAQTGADSRMMKAKDTEPRGRTIPGAFQGVESSRPSQASNRAAAS